MKEVKKEYVVYWKKMYEDVSIPQYETEGAVGMDIQSYEDYDLHPNEQAIMATGLKLQMPQNIQMQRWNCKSDQEVV